MHLTIKIAATRTKPADAGYKTPDFILVRVGGESSAASGFPDPGDWLSRWDLVCLAAILIVRALVQDIRKRTTKIRSSLSKTRREGRKERMADWLEHSVQVEVEAPIEFVWSLWSDLEQMPRWMKWIESVKVPEDNPELSFWTLNTGGLQFTWKSRILKMIPNQIIQWESIDGLPNQGAIRFYDRKDSSIVKLSISYAIPGILGKIMDNLFLGRAVESTIKADLERFREYALRVKSNPF